MSVAPKFELTSSELFRRLLSYSFRYWKGFVVALIGMIVAAGTETALPALMKQLTDNGFQGDSDFQIWWVPVAVLLIFLIRGGAVFTASYCMYWVSNNVLRDIRRAMFEKLIAMPCSTIDSRSSGQLIAKLISEAQMVLFAATSVLTTLVKDSLVLIGLLAWLLWLNWKLTLIVGCLIPALAFITVKFSRRMRRVSRDYMSAVSNMTAKVEESVSGNRVIKIFGGEAYEQKRFDAVNLNYRGRAMRLAVAAALQAPVSQFIAAIGVAAVLTIALIQGRAGTTTIGDFFSFVTAMLLMLPPLKHLADVNSQLQKGLAAAENVFAMLDEESERDRGEQSIMRARGEIQFQGASLQYPARDTPAVAELNLIVRPGETFAFVGPSGSGKSSLMNLLPRLYELTYGSIKLDGVDIRDLTLRSLRSQIALVSQDVVLFNDTIENNIAYGREDISVDVIQNAVQAADLGAFVDSLPLKMQTVVGDRGVRISGGQRQRIAIARAIVKDAPILILDEATSALDTKSEANVQAAIDRLRRGRTTLIVAHRLSTVVNADQIVVMDHGRIIQQGSHQQLMAQPGLYQSLYLQMQKG